MSTAEPNTVERMRSIAETARTNPEAFKESIQTMTAEDLNELSRQILEAQKESINEDVRRSVRERLRAIDEADANTNLEQLEARLASVKTLIGTEQPESAAVSTFGGIQEFMGGGMAFIRRSFTEVLKPRNMKRILYTIIASPGLLGLENIPFLSGMVDRAKREIAMLDIEKTIEEVGVKDVFPWNGKCTEAEWFKFKQLQAKDQTVDIHILTSDYITEMQKGNITPGSEEARITLGRILEPKKAQDALVVQALEKKKEATKSFPAWKEIGVTSVTFGSETKVSSGVLTVAETDIEIDGTPKAGSNAEKLQKAKKELQHAKTLILSNTENSKITIDTNASERSVSMPFDGVGVELAQIDTLVQLNDDKFRTIVIQDNNTIETNQIRTVLDGEYRTIHARKNKEVLAAIGSEKLKNVSIPREEAIFTFLASGDFQKVEKAPNA